LVRGGICVKDGGGESGRVEENESFENCSLLTLEPSRELPNAVDGGRPAGVNDAAEEGGGPAGVVDGWLEIPAKSGLGKACFPLTGGVEGGLEE